MTGLLRHPPAEAQLERLYFELAQVGASSVGAKRAWPYRPADLEALLALAGEMLRYDPRLLSILLQFFLLHFSRLNPLRLRQQMHAMRWPQALLVVFEFVKSETGEAELRYLADYLAAGFARVEPSERFFIDAERPASRVALRRLGRNLAAYARWGFIGQERPVADPITKRAVGRYDARTRSQILSELIERRGELTLADYLAAVDHAISRQQALADLRAHPRLRVEGHGRGARWRSAS